MIREVGLLEAPVAAVRALFADLEGWPGWMPGMLATRILNPEAAGEVRRVEVRQKFQGRTARHILEIHLSEDRLLQKGVQGWPRWQGEWRFQPAPRGGTTVSLELELELGMMALLSPKGWVQRFARTLFQDTLTNARQALHRRAIDESGATTDQGDPVLFALYETPEGLELLLEGEVYTVRRKG